MTNTDPTGLQYTGDYGETSDGNYGRYDGDRVPTPEEWAEKAPTQAQVEKVKSDVKEILEPITDHLSLSITGRLVSPGASATSTVTSSGIDLGGGLATTPAASLTVDLNISIPVPSPLPFSVDIGASGQPPSWPTGTTAGVDFIWTDTGFSFSFSAGIGVGKFEGHILLTDNVVH